ncbi:hypothetical protein [Pontibacter populi]|uniref:SWFGD domain-containing protein n=1 Tax=Pontibacter populi TaxID=890055 RepID=A0ABV1RT29_9BACT
MRRRDEYDRDRSYGGFYGTSSDGGYTHDYDNQNRSVGRDGGHELGAARSMRGNDYYFNADRDSERNSFYRQGRHDYNDGAAYGYSNYSRQQNQDQYNTAPYEDYIDYSSRNYGSFEGSREPDYSSRGNYNTGGRDRNNDYESRNYGIDNYERNQGFDRSFEGMPRGYGSTRYDERDLDRERSVFGGSNNYNRSWDRDNEERYR